MNNNEYGKLRIAILFGGHSSEYGVSLQSAHAVINHLDREKYSPVLIGITQEGDWYLYQGDPDKLLNDTWHEELHRDHSGKEQGNTYCIPVSVSPNRSDRCLLCYSDRSVTKIPIDAALPVLHGRNGEDGTVQGVFELAGIPVIGCGVLASALCMDKDRAHKLVQAAGIRTPKAYTIEKNDAKNISLALYHSEHLGYPLFVKPVKAGSSYGVTKVSKRRELVDAIHKAFQYDDCVIIEEAISGFEVGCAVMGNEELTVGEVDEIELQSGFFDFTEKYTLKTSAIHVPARINKNTSDRIKQASKMIYQTLGCRGFARVDMFLTPEGEIVFNEVNTIPGFTSHSRFPNMMKAVGISFEQIIDTIIELGMKEQEVTEDAEEQMRNLV